MRIQESLKVVADRSDPSCNPHHRLERKEAIPMQLILVVCGAGASSTFLASRMRRLATARGLDVTARAASALDIDSRLAAASVLLVGPHLEPQFPDLRTRAAAYGVPALLLPESAFGADGAASALDQALVPLNVTIEGAPHA
jgi:cellobiose PTS system EIIB component